MYEITTTSSAESPLLNPRRFLAEAWGDLSRSRGTAIRLFRQSIAQRYRYSSLGLLWAFAPPVVTALVLTLSNRSSGAADLHAAVPPAFYAVFGLVLAQTFLETFGTQRALFNTHRYLLSRHRVPIEGLILTGLADSLFSLLIKLGILTALFLFYRIAPGPGLLLGLIGIGSIGLLGAGLGLLLAPLSALKRDLDNVMQFFPWVLFGLTPVFVAPRVGAALFQIYRYNPLTWLFDAVRACSYGHPTGYGTLLLFACCSAAILLPLSWLLCRIARAYVVERFLM